uniref:Dedicator of cytokinesis protein 3 n=1 Tax=Timema tahoe TaxID=61484 RepID=A0A7R9NYQ1_9NEOP|nr:unnamed protein product [Timema tahoe]
MLHGELPQVREENPLLFKNCSLTKKLGFSDVIMPGDVRNDLYLTLEKGEFERGGKSTGKNIEVTILVLDAEGKILENCLWGASGCDGTNEYQSMIIYHHNSPWWAETIRLAVPIDKFYGSHIRLEYRHCSTREKTDNKKLFGFSFARLMESGGATLRDGQHELYIYKCEDRTRLDSSVYLQLTSSAVDTTVAISSTNSAFSRSSKETVYIHTLLCSTKLTQNVDLLSLLQWKEHPDMIQQALDHVLHLGGEELVKFLQDVLDALFSMFSTEDGNSTTHSGLVFHALVSIFSLMDDSKFEHFRPVMDAYIKGHFAAALVYKGLLSSVQHCADWVSSTEKQEPIQKCFRSLEYIFKFIIQSRLLFARATGGQYEDNFKKDLYNVFTALNKMLSSSYDVILPTQCALLHSISAVYEQLMQVLPVIEVTKLATAMLESLPRDLSPQLTQAKLTAIRNLVTSKLFTDDGKYNQSRNMLLSICCKHLRVHLAHRDELRLCTEILGEILTFLFKQRQSQEQGKVNNCLHHDVEILCLTTLDMLIQTVLIIIDRSAAVLSYPGVSDSKLWLTPNLGRYEGECLRCLTTCVSQGCLVACLVGLLQLLDEFHYKRLWEELGDRKPKKDFLLRVFLVFRDLVKQEVFPADWLIIKMVINNIMLSALQELAQPLVFDFLDTHHFDNQLWSNYFNLAVAYLTQPSLQLEKFSEVKREKIIEKYGDMRVLMGFQILSMWSNLGENKINFIPSMVGPFLEVTLVPESELRKATLHIFFDMMDCEQKARGNFKQVSFWTCYFIRVRGNFKQVSFWTCYLIRVRGNFKQVSFWTCYFIRVRGNIQQVSFWTCYFIRVRGNFQQVSFWTCYFIRVRGNFQQLSFWTCYFIRMRGNFKGVRGNFQQVESELIDKLDILISENKGDDEYRQLFNTMLLDRVQSEDPAWKDSGAAFISSVTRLLERLLDYRSVIQGDENRDKRMSCTVNLLNFYKNEINRKEMYLRYIYKLHDLHLPADNFTEAGFTMKLYADQLTWTSRVLVSDPQYAGLQEWQRKEQLYNQIITYFDRGKCWEKGIPLCKELADLYECRLFDYSKLSKILRTQANFFDNILTQLRPEPEYFRVGFYGLSFPLFVRVSLLLSVCQGESATLFVRNKLFVYRGLEYERIGAFTQRLQTEFPSAQILMKNSPPDDSVINSDGQYCRDSYKSRNPSTQHVNVPLVLSNNLHLPDLNCFKSLTLTHTPAVIQICNVKPLPEESTLFGAGGDIPEKISSFYQVNDVRRFQLDRPVHKGTIDKDNEFKSLWVERTLLVTSSSLPGILRWFEVVEKSVEEVAPVQYACETMDNVNKELRQLINTYTIDRKRNINPFSMRLQVPEIYQVSLMPMSWGASLSIQQAFFVPEFTKLYPEFSDHVFRLKTLTLDQIEILNSALHLHGQLAPSGVQPLHRRLQERFAQLKQGLRDLSLNPRGRGKSQDTAASIINTPLPPLPVEKKQTPSSRSSGGSSAYGHTLTGEDDEDIYSKPMELLERMNGVSSSKDLMNVHPPPPIPLRETRPRSAGYNMAELARTPTRGTTDYSSLPPMKSSKENLDAEPAAPRPPKPTHQRSLSKPLSFPSNSSSSGASSTDVSASNSSGQLRNSWSEVSMEEAPPLPPRGQTPDKRNTTHFVETPPPPPKRLVKKSSASSVFYMDSSLDASLDSEQLNMDSEHDLRDSGYSEFPTSGSQTTPSNNFNNLSYEDFDLSQRRSDVMNISSPPPPPPIPPKSVVTSAPLGSETPNGTLERGGVHVASEVENYSVPKLQTQREGPSNSPT